MNKYERTPDLIIDLHGRTLAEAEIILDDVFSKNHSHIRIITGKGKHSKNDPVLRSFVAEYLLRNNFRFNQSKLQNGGEGAIEVYLKD
jgi:DNA-nicking Smr family endonuclease